MNNLQTANKLTLEKTESLLNNLKNVKIGLIGDVCLDAYWRANMCLSELSRETPHYPLPVIQEKYSLGACGNVASNLAALEPSKLLPIMITGKDWRRQIVYNLFEEKNISTDYLIIGENRVTNGYFKPYRRGISNAEYEDPRIDFINTAPISEKDEKCLLACLDSVAKEVDMLCVVDQVSFGCITARIREKICKLGKEGLPVIVDSRDNADKFSHVLTKPNEVELARIIPVSGVSLQDFASAAQTLSQRNHAPVCCTLGGNGCIIIDHDKTATHVPAHHVDEPIDICGAGDAFIAAFAMTKATGASMAEAAQIAVLAAGIVIQKIGETGSASKAEILEKARILYEL